MRVFEIKAVSFVALTYVVVCVAPFHTTNELDAKFDPFAVNVNAAPPAVTLVGEMEVRTGTVAVLPLWIALEVLCVSAIVGARSRMARVNRLRVRFDIVPPMHFRTGWLES